MKTAEPKHKNYNHGLSTFQHDVVKHWVLNNDAQMPTEGTGDDQRNGDQIYSGGYCLRAMINQFNDRPNVTYKYWVMRTPRDVTYSYSEFFDNVTGNVLLDPPNKDYVKVLTSGTIKPGASVQYLYDRRFTFPFKLWIPHKKLVKFGPADGAIKAVEDKLWFLMVAYDAQDTAALSNVAEIAMTTTLYYKDP